jgi:hypothetical protein
MRLSVGESKAASTGRGATRLNGADLHELNPTINAFGRKLTARTHKAEIEYTQRIHEDREYLRIG